MRAGLALAACLLSFGCIAGNASHPFSVNITLTGSGAVPANGVCVSQSLSEQNGAIVRVVCDSGQFVSISPIPGARFVGTHGGAYTHYFGSSYRGANIAGLGEFANGAGSVAAFRVFGVTDSGERLDLLVSF